MKIQSKADIHIHTNFSDGLNDPEAVVNYAATHTDLRVIAITDHNTIDGARVAEAYWRKHRQTFAHLDLIKGVEVSTAEGHVLALFVEEDIPEGMSAVDTVTAVHEQGGVAVAAHPFTHLLSFTGLHGVGKLIGHVPFDGVEARSSLPTELYANWFTSFYNRRHAKLPELGSSDAHYLTMIGKTYTLFDGCTAVEFRKAVENGLVWAGGHVNGPTVIWQVLRHLIKRRELHHLLPQDHIHQRQNKGLHMEVKLNRLDDTAVLDCGGTLIGNNVDLLLQEVDRLLASNFKHFILKMSGLSFIDSTGVGGMIAAYKRVKGVDGHLLLCAPSPPVHRVLSLSRLDTLFPTVDDERSGQEYVLNKKPILSARGA